MVKCGYARRSKPLLLQAQHRRMQRPRNSRTTPIRWVRRLTHGISLRRSHVLHCAAPYLGMATDGWSRPTLASACRTLARQREPACLLWDFHCPWQRWKRRLQENPVGDPPSADMEFFLDVCCGASSPLSCALASSNVACVRVDMLGEEPLDLSCDAVYDRLLRLAFSGCIRFAHASPPCRDYSRLKLRPGGPPAIRSPEHMDGA